MSHGLIGCADTQPVATVGATIEESTVEESTVEESSEEESTIEETEEQTEAKRDGIYAFQIQINGVDYELPCTYQAFVSNGWEFKGYTVEEDGHYLTVRDRDSLMCFIEFEIFDGVLGSIRFSNSFTSEEYTNSLK